MAKNKEPEIVEKELWDHYSELPNPSWYEYIADKDIPAHAEDITVIIDSENSGLSAEQRLKEIKKKINETFYKTKV